MEYQNLRPGQIVEARKKLPLAYVAFGLLEWHGLHNPVGLDGLKAHAVVNYLAEKIGGLVMPPLFWADHRGKICEVVFDPAVSSWLPAGTPDHSTAICEFLGLPRARLEEEGRRSERKGGHRLWKELVVHIFFEIESLGFRMVVAYPGHAPMYAPLDEAVRQYHDEGGTCRVFAFNEQMVCPGDHAAKLETSLALRLFPELVDLTQLDEDSPYHLGVLGTDPLAHASREYGDEVLQKIEEMVRREVDRWLRSEREER